MYVAFCEVRRVTELAGDPFVVAKLVLEGNVQQSLALHDAMRIPQAALLPAHLYLNGLLTASFALPLEEIERDGADEVWVAAGDDWEVRLRVTEKPATAFAPPPNPFMPPIECKVAIGAPVYAVAVELDSIETAFAEHAIFFSLRSLAGLRADSEARTPARAEAVSFETTFNMDDEIGVWLVDNVVDKVVAGSQAETAGVRVRDALVRREGARWTWQRPGMLRVHFSPLILDQRAWGDAVEYQTLELKAYAARALNEDDDVVALAYQFGGAAALAPQARMVEIASAALDVPSAGCRSLALPRHMHLSVSVTSTERRIAQHAVCLVKLSADLAGVGLAVSSDTDDVVYAAVQRVRAYAAQFASKRRIVDVAVGHFQVDDQTPGAVWPVVLAPQPVALSVASDAPALRATALFVAEENAVHVELLETFCGETALRMHESFLLALQALGKAFTASLPAMPVSSVAAGSSQPQHRDARRIVHVERADLLPMRFNLSFGLTASGVAGLSDMLDSVPLLGALLAAVASVSDAPLRLDGVKLTGETRTLGALSAALVRHYSAALMRGVLSLAGSTDLLGSPVKLLDSLSKGAFSFFFEPALALSMGFGDVGAGLTRGSTVLVKMVAGGLLDSVNKFCRTVSVALSRATLSEGSTAELIRVLARLDGGPDEPLGVGEAAVSASLVLAGGVLRAVVGLGREPWRGGGGANLPRGVARAVAGLLVQPAVGLLTAVAQLAVGLRNMVTQPGVAHMQARLPRQGKAPSEALFAYSARRASGARAVRARLGAGAAYVTHTHVVALGGSVAGRATMLLLTDKWLLCGSEGTAGTPVWAVPLSALGEPAAADKTGGLTVPVAGALDIALTCRSDAIARLLSAAVDRTRRGLACRASLRKLEAIASKEAQPEPVYDAARMAAEAALASFTGQPRLRARVTVPIDELSELDVLEDVAVEATIESYGVWPDGVSRFRVRLRSRAGVEWAVQRRFSEFVAFRDGACAYLGVSRRNLVRTRVASVYVLGLTRRPLSHCPRSGRGRCRTASSRSARKGCSACSRACWKSTVSSRAKCSSSFAARTPWTCAACSRRGIIDG